MLTILAPLAGGWAAAHGFGQSYALPVPLGLYLAGSAATVLLSFVVAALFIRSGRAQTGYPTLNLLRWAPFRWLVGPAVLGAVEVLSVATFLLILGAGLIGSTNPTRNIAPTLVWIYWWVGVTYVSALVGNIWPLINPWRILWTWAERLARRNDPDAGLSLGLPYPKWLAAWPAVLLFFAFAWFENAFHDPSRPSNIAAAALMYSVITWGGMIVFGKTQWLRNAEVFTLVFGLYARFAPTETRLTEDGMAVCRRQLPEGERDGVDCFKAAPDDERELNLRPFGVGLLATRSVSVSLTALVLLVLSSVTFDGFTETPAWAMLVVEYYSSVGRIDGVATIGLLAVPLIFSALYLVCVAAMPRFAGRSIPLALVASSFVLSLVPIALAYHLAHYFSYLVVGGQDLLRLASDPFGYGWNLFDTGDFHPNAQLIPAQFAWYTAVLSVVAGHVLAVWLAHVAALRLFAGRSAATLSQIPMLALMVAYTAVSLWILAQPIIESG